MALVACIALAALSLLAPSAPTTDSWGWVVWGREVAGLDLDTDVGPSPAWKPLPVLFTLPFSLAGDAAPQLWLWLARSASLFAVVLAFRLASRFGGRFAGALAAIFLLLADQWLRGAAHGYSEGLVAALLLAAAQLHLDGRGRGALAALYLAGLARPEAWPFLGVYAFMFVRRDPEARWWTYAALGSLPLLWVGADWWGSGELLHGTQAAASAAGSLTPFEVLGRGAALVGAPVLLLAGVAGVAAWRDADRDLRALAGCTVAWIALVCVLVAVGWPDSPRFLIPAGAFTCVLAGVGAASLVRAAPSLHLPRPAVAVLLVALVSPFVVSRVELGERALATAEDRARFQSDLQLLALRARAGAPYAVPRDLSWTKGAVAWKLDVPLSQVAALDRDTGLPDLDGHTVLSFAASGPRERQLSAGSRRAPALLYPLPDTERGDLTLFVPLRGRPTHFGGARLHLRLLARTARWAAWRVRWAPPA